MAAPEKRSRYARGNKRGVALRRWIRDRGGDTDRERERERRGRRLYIREFAGIVEIRDIDR